MLNTNLNLRFLSKSEGNRFSIFLLAIIIFGFLSCKKEKSTELKTLTFDIDRFEENIQRYLNQNTVGYAYAINHKSGQLYSASAWGDSRISFDYNVTSSLPASPDIRLAVSSISKFITAILAVKILDNNGIDINSSIIPYLPKDWQDQIPSPNKLFAPTFLELLQTKSRYQFNTVSLTPNNEQLLEALLLPFDNSLYDNETYQNGNFAIFRVLLSKIVTNNDEQASNMNLSCLNYINLINSEIFSKLNIPNVQLYFEGQNEPGLPGEREWPMCYDWGLNGLNTTPMPNGFIGVIPINQFNRAAESGMRISMRELAKLLAYFKHDNNNVIVTPAQRKIILDNRLGLTESQNNYLCKSGTYSFSSNNRIQRAFIMFFDNDVEVCISTHTQVGSIEPNSSVLPAVNGLRELLIESHKNANN